MTKYINEPTVLRQIPEGLTKPYLNEKDYYRVDGAGVKHFDYADYRKDLDKIHAALASQPTFLKIGSGWERFKEGDTVDGSEVEISEDWVCEKLNGDYTGSEYLALVARLKHKEALAFQLPSIPKRSECKCECHTNPDTVHAMACCIDDDKEAGEESVIIEQYQRLFNAISETKGIPIQSEMDDIIRIVKEDFLNSK
jgi:hypothetical protein